MCKYYTKKVWFDINARYYKIQQETKKVDDFHHHVMTNFEQG